MIAGFVVAVAAGVLITTAIHVGKHRPIAGDALFTAGIVTAAWALVTIGINARRWLDEATAWDWWVVLPAAVMVILCVLVAFAALIVALDRGERP